jgi:hypothetical protein
MGKGILVFVPTNIRGMCMEAVLPTPSPPWRTVVGVLFHDSSVLGLSASLALTYCVLALSRNDLGSLIEICSLSYKGGPYLETQLCSYVLCW